MGDTRFFNSIQAGRTRGREYIGWIEWDGQNSITENSCTAPPLPHPPCPPNDITISCKGSSHYPSCSTNGRDISACLFQPTSNTDPIQTANRSSCCCHGNSILPSLLPRGASFNSITRPGETVSKRAYPCNSVLQPTLSPFTITVRTFH